MKQRDPNSMPPFAAEVYHRMVARNLSQKALAREAGLADTYVRDLFEGRKKSVTIDGARALAKALGCSVGELIGEISPKHIFDEADRTAFRDAVHSVLCVNLAMLVDEGVLDFDSRGVEDLSWALTQTIEEYALSRVTEPPDRTVAGRTATVVDLTRARLARGG